MSLTGSIAAIRPKRMPWPEPLLIAYLSLLREAEVVQAVARVFGGVAMDHQADRNACRGAEHSRRRRVENERLDTGFVQVVMRHPDRGRVDAGKNFFELRRVGRFIVRHAVQFLLAMRQLVEVDADVIPFTR